MTSKHTPGPWANDTHLMAIAAILRGEIGAESFDGDRLATTVDRIRDTAPDLLEAAKAAFVDMGSWADRDPEVWGALHAAIAKAEGDA